MSRDPILQDRALSARRKRHARRPERGERVELNKRDLALFHGLFEARVMLREQIAELFFDGSYDAAGKRLQKLMNYRYLRERRVGDRRGEYLPRWISLAEPAFVALRAAGLVEARFTWDAVKNRLASSASSLAHDLDVVDLWCAFVRAIDASKDHTLKDFSTWPYRYQFDAITPRRNGSSILLPDAFAVIEYDDDSEFSPFASPLFFEWDRSTEGRTVLCDKAAGYDHFYRSGKFAERCGGTRKDVEAYPFRTIFAVKTEERRNNLLEELARPQRRPQLIADQFWCTTWEEIRADPLGAIYLHSDDYRAVTKGSMYDPARFVTKQRVIHRDELVREKAVKRRLIG